jgi:predicted phage terminase large subunit-like protein
MSGHSGILADRFYTDVFKLTTSEEYTFSEIFPQIKIPKTSSDKNELRYDEVESFATLTCRGIDGTWTGAVDISSDGYLYVDDMVRDRTESLSPKRLENRYQDYLNVLVDRKNDGSRELMVGTRWNVLDPLGRVEANNSDNPRYRFRKIPALNEQGESNFVYDYGKGFSTEYYVKMRDSLDKNEWMAKYQQKPFIREGLLFPEDELNFYNGVLPDGDCLTAAACDVAWGGGDSLSMPFGKAFGSREDGPIYIADWIFNGGDKYITKPIVVAKTLQHQPNMEKFEANNGGDEYAESVDTLLKEQGFKTNISWAKASNQVGKLAKIIQYAPDVKKRFYFLAPELQSEEYKDAMAELMMFTQVGKNAHDDAPDGLVQLIQLISGEMYAKCEAMERPW